MARDFQLFPNGSVTNRSLQNNHQHEIRILRNLSLENNNFLMNQRILDETESQLQEARLSPSPVRQQRGQQSRFSNLTSIEQVLGRIRSIAREEVGSQFLIKKLSEKNPKEISWILWEMKYELHELMIHYYGNQVVRKMFEVINERQRSIILNLITLDHRKFVDVCIHDIGTLSMQKFIEHNTFPYPHALLFAITSNILQLATVLNGGYVIQKCLMMYPSIASKEILDAAADYCLQISTHKNGCSVIQKCLTYAKGPSMGKLIGSIIFYAIRLVDDPFGNYVVQFIIKMRISFINSLIAHKLGGRYVEFSTNKYASNVVEDLFKFADQITVALMIQELMDSPNFLSVLQNPFGNYVVQRALEFSQGLDVHSTLWYKIMLNQMYLQSDPYGKRVLSFARASMPRLNF